MSEITGGYAGRGKKHETEKGNGACHGADGGWFPKRAPPPGIQPRHGGELCAEHPGLRTMERRRGGSGSGPDMEGTAHGPVRPCHRQRHAGGT